MRRSISSWTDTFRKLGLRRWKPRSEPARKIADGNTTLQFEELERKQMLSGVTISITGPADSIREGSGDTAEFTVELSGPATSVVEVVIESNDGTAVGSGWPVTGDFLHGSGTLTFAIGQTISTFGAEIPFEIGDDTLAESDETFTVDLSNPTGGATIDTNAGSATATITDDALVLVTGPSEAIREGSGDKAAFTVVLAEPTDHVVKVEFDTIEISATEGSDYNSLSGTLTFEIGETVSTLGATGLVTILDDTLDESDETFSLDVTNVIGGDVASGSGSTTATITDDALVLVSGPAEAIREASGDTANFTVTLAEATDHVVEVTIETTNGTAVGSGYPVTGDFLHGSGTLTFLVGQTVAAFGATVNIEIGDDTLDESDETFTVDVINVDGGSVAAGNDSTTATITDDALVLFSGPASSVTEGVDQYAVFTVTLAEPTDHVVEVVLETSNGTAVGSGWPITGDFLHGSGTLTFQIGQTVAAFGATVNVEIGDDTLVESDETFTVNILSVLGGDADDDSEEATIISDD